MTLQELNGFDSRPVKNADENRYLCCLSESCRSKPRDAAHRSLCVNTSTGFYNCHRCGAKGKLKDFWDERPKFSKRQHQHLKLTAQFSAPIRKETDAEKTSDQQSESLIEKMRVFQQNFADSPAEDYLRKRGIMIETARRANCGFAPAWEHWEKREGNWILIGSDRRVVFPICNQNGELAAIHGRAIDSEFLNSPKITKGDKSLGVFAASQNALDSRIAAICEGQIDALALSSCGVVAFAMTGTSAPDWLLKKLAFKAVLIATDADEAGDKAALKLRYELELRGAKTFRLRPRAAKDWAEVLENKGVEKLKNFFAPFVLDTDDETITNFAWRFFQENRTEAAVFLTNLIQNGEVREYLRERIRRAEAN